MLTATTDNNVRDIVAVQKFLIFKSFKRKAANPQIWVSLGLFSTVFKVSTVNNQPQF